MLLWEAFPILKRGYNEVGFSGYFFVLVIFICCFVVAICDIVHNVEITFYLCQMLTVSKYLFGGAVA